MFTEIVITPDQTVTIEVVGLPYRHSVWQKASKYERDKDKKKIDVQLPDGRYMHTINTNHGIYILIHADYTL